ncbi:flavin-containing monooxygenase FMO GS-OX-like 4 isoform X1 [Centruroides sculpturatus]|uniref:flavin-containing monooxygenase FMO GS-OX-like 4 isoform X1 n=2 Tax=Centruroides sculpturatus TaxID=218467 RepID=UPI000C6EB129|nr:flavin-containing monooxygenase FMO GS-OX-like 4 isoform X1 [Centruroides sculpturatus]XP_023224549.1 flavin-containing monooxygenase FMO GS-OX-like 4 isoform X1 [Centruroides sculpturatus]XP_023224550.1 flavin-containing monooxygenase FMO GS-OX-like 4 isoform X1 [Centruroides sculpturatus]
MEQIIRVAVIGAGPAGLCAARNLKSNPIFQFVVYESQNEIGGTWIFTEEIGNNKYGQPIQSSMYRDLRTNLPKEIMGYPDFPFPSTGESFIHHSEVLKYLRNYAQHHQLSKYIELNSCVKEIKPKKIENKIVWIIKSHHMPSNSIKENTFDAVMMCNGHYSSPYIPKIIGLDKFNKLVMHSHEYRSKEIFKNLKVVILGASQSGCDIAIEIADVAEEVILSHNQPFIKSPFPTNTVQKPGIDFIENDTVIFLNSEKYKPDALLFCTGYDYDFDVLHSSVGLKITEKRIIPLYKHLIHINFPTLAFIGIISKILPFPIFHQQIIFFLKVLDGSIILPSKEDMKKDTEKDFEYRKSLGMPIRHSHLMGSLQWMYDKEISSMGKFSPIKPVVVELYNYVGKCREKNLMTYKNDNYCILDGHHFVQKE